MNWNVDETYIRVGGTWRYLWRAIDANGQLVDFMLTAGRDAQAAKAFLNKEIERVRLHRPVSICTDKALTYRKAIREINHRYDPHFDTITHIDRKYLNNRIAGCAVGLRKHSHWDRQAEPLWWGEFGIFSLCTKQIGS